MSVHIIELNDRNVRLRNRDDVLVQSPGFANIAGKQPIFGEEARRIAHLHPRQTFTQFWSQLSLDPLVNASSHFRHQADLAFAHLNDISARHALKDEVIFAVPSNYNRNQLSILLGLVQSCEFDATGLVDMPLLAAGGADQPEHTVFLDIQLHQSVLTGFTLAEGKVARDKVVQIPGTGLLALHDAWANMVTDEFIRQSRFDPQHNAETEQYVYNQLETWIAHALRDNEILMEINNKGSVYQARINRGHFEQRVRNIFSRLKVELENLAGDRYALLTLDEHASLPGLDLYLKNISAVQDALMLEQCLANLDHIRGEPGALNFVTSLPASGNVRPATATPGDASTPTHVLVNHRAFALPATIRFGAGNETGALNGRAVLVATDGDSGELSLAATAAGVQLTFQGDTGIAVNGNPAASGTGLRAGDTIAIAGSGANVQLIQVE